MTDAQIHIPGSKYVANRVLLISGLAGGRSSISNVPDNDDIRLLLGALGCMGIRFNEAHGRGEKEKTLEVWGIDPSRDSSEAGRVMDVGESGTLLRFLIGFACLLPGETTITAGVRNMERPALPLIQALTDLGAEITVIADKIMYPIKIEKGLVGGRTALTGDVSSQFISSLLMVSPYAENDVEIKVMKPIVSSGYIDLTIREMERSGVFAKRIRKAEYDLFRIQAGQRYSPRSMKIPKDWSSANYLLAASVILNREIKIDEIDVRSNPGESEFVSILKRMGCRVYIGSQSVSILNSEILNGIEVDMKDSPDSVLTLIAVALFARGTTLIKNIGHLIHKESDRIKQVEKELNKIGAHVRTTDDSITIVGRNQLHGATVECHNDHRLAMCLGLAKLKNRSMTIVNRECVRKSFPLFWECLRTIDEGGEKCLEIP